MGFSEVVLAHRVIVCVGSGGVGKTTTSAAIALHWAMRGKNVLCLTIDPARRLANSLGLVEMRTDIQEIAAPLFDASGLVCKGSLHAMMLDTKQTFDELVHKYARSSAIRERILRNTLYQYISTSLAGTQEYMAMEKLYSVRSDPRWDLIVLDTPPTTHALDFISAPERLVDAIDSTAMRWFLETFHGAGKLSLNLVGKGAQFLLRGLARFTGGQFLTLIAEFVTDINELFGGFAERARKVAEAFRSDDVAFVVVTTPAPFAADEALFLQERLASSGIRLEGLVVNAVHEVLADNPLSEQLSTELAAVVPEGIQVETVAAKLKQAYAEHQLRARLDREQIAALRKRFAENLPIAEVPAFDLDVHDLRGLASVADHVFEAMPMK